MANTWYSSMRDCRAICMWQSLRARAGWDHHDGSRLRDETICPRHGLTTGKRSSLIPTAMGTGTFSASACWSEMPRTTLWVPENKPDPGSVRTLPGSCTGITPRKALELRLQCVCCGCRSRSALQSRCSKPVAERQFDVHLDTCRVS